MAETKKSAVMVLRQYFGYQPGQTASGFADEFKKLGDAEKAELARLVVRELGLRQEDISFSLEENS